MSDNESKVPLPDLEGGSAMQTVEDAGGLAAGDNETINPGAADPEALLEVPVQASTVHGRARMPAGDLLKPEPNAVLELDRKVGEAIDIYINNRLVARGEVVLVEEKLGMTMTEIIKADPYFAKKYSEANGLPVRPRNVRELEITLHRAVLLSSGPEISVDGILSSEGARLDQLRGSGAVAHAAMAAEQVTRKLVGRTVAEAERDLILETLKHCLGNRTHAANILGISIRTLRNKLNEYAADGAPIPPPNGELKGAA